MKKKIYLIGAALAVITGLVSCDLNSQSLTEKDTTNFPVNSDDANEALAGIYENLNTVNAFPQESFYYLSMLASDDNLGGGGANDKLMQAVDLMCNYQINMTEDFWKARYQGINRANTLIEALGNVNLDPATKSQTLGEAKFMRAFFYYELASMYGRVPLVTTPVAPSDPTPPSAAVIWGQILQDLYEASTTMPAVKHGDGHVDKYCAEAMLCRAWLFYTGFYCNGEKLSDLTSTTYTPLTSVTLPNGTTLTKEDVIKCIDDCVNSSGYSLVSDYRNLWAYTNRCIVEDYPYTKGKGLKWAEDDNAVNPESMFAIKFNKLASWSTTIGYGNGYALHFGVRGGQNYANTFPFGQGWGAGPVAPNLVNDWHSADPNGKDIRLKASVEKTSDMPGYIKGGASWADFVQETDYFEKKQSAISCKNPGGLKGWDIVKNPYLPVFELSMYGVDGWINNNPMQTGNIHDLVLLRFADALLMQSELEENVSGINKVRARAGLDLISSYSLSALQNERRWELAFEGTRWNDIRRWHIAAAALEKQTNQPVYYSGADDKNTAHNGGYTARYNATAGFQKIPENQISLSNGTLSQNAGFTDASSDYNGWK